MLRKQEIAIPYAFICLGLVGIVSLLALSNSEIGKYGIFIFSIIVGFLLRSKWKDYSFNDNNISSN